MRNSRLILPACIVAALFVQGCVGSWTTYRYRIVTDGCNCEEYNVADKQLNIEYTFSARYRMEKGILTTVEIGFRNRSNDTLFLDLGLVKIESRNITYLYNNKFIPLPGLAIPPSLSDKVTMSGKDVSGTEDWNKIAGEQLTITLKSLRLGVKSVPSRTVQFVPSNPKLSDTHE